MKIVCDFVVLVFVGIIYFSVTVNHFFFLISFLLLLILCSSCKLHRVGGSACQKYTYIFFVMEYICYEKGKWWYKKATTDSLFNLKYLKNIFGNKEAAAAARAEWNILLFNDVLFNSIWICLCIHRVLFHTMYNVKNT